MHTTLDPAHVVCIDIETGHAPKKAIEREIEDWTPPKNLVDEEKIKKAREDFISKVTEKSALLDASPILCISARTEKGGMLFNGMDSKSYKVNHSQVVSCGNERMMLEAFRMWLDNVTTDQTIIIGFNIYGFDLPRMRAAFMRHKLRLPRIMAPRLLSDERQPTVDVMKTFLRGFTAEYSNEKDISLNEVAFRLSLPQYKDQIDGSKIPDLARAGKVREILTYCAVDTMATLRAHQLMTSTAPDME